MENNDSESRPTEAEEKQELEEAVKLAEERLESLKYLQADFDNYRKNFEKEKESIIRLANENIIKELLVILDDFETALLEVEDEKNKEGMLLLHRKFYRILESHGLKRIEALGRKFDPFYHEAIMKEKSPEEDETVLGELQRGFMLKSKVIRPARVKIAENSSAKNDASAENSENGKSETDKCETDDNK